MDLIQNLISEQTKKICKTYKIEPQNVQKRLQQDIQSNQELSDLINKAKNLKQIYKTKVFKDFIKKIKKEIYYDLRTYQKDFDKKGTLTDTHISTKERSPHLKNLFEQIHEHLKNSETILDIGGGLFPASFPFENYPNLKHYIWLDKDVKSYQKLKKQKYINVRLFNDRIGEKDWHEYLPEGQMQFDFVFMLKLIPVVARQENKLLDELGKTPFKLALITGSKEAMVKKIDIEKREDAVIKDFIEKSGWNVLKKVDIPNEFGYIVNSPI